MSPFELVFVALFCGAWPLYTARFGLPAMRRRVEAGLPGARRDEYRDTMFMSWMFAALAAAAALQAGRQAAAYRLVLPTGIGLAIGITLIAGTFLLYHRQGKAVARATGRAAIRRAIAPLAWFLPHDVAERTLFRMVSVTAGVTEEWLFRGFLLALFTPGMGVAGAIVASSVLFGVGHAYQGPAGIVRTGIVGLVLAGITWATGSLVPAIVIHAMVDWMQGDIVVRVLADDPAEPETALSAAGAA